MKSKGNGAKGMYSTKSNPKPMPKMTKPGTGPSLSSGNSDQAKVGSLRTKAYAEKDSLRGKNGI